jgi:cytochrome c peroxidase
MRTMLVSAAGVFLLAVAISGQGASSPTVREGKRLFEDATFGGNGRTCRTCHSSATGTVSPDDVAKRLKKDPNDILFVHDGSDDGQGQGVSRMLKDATVLVTIPLPANVILADDPSARSVTLRRAVASTLNTPALDPVLMLDGRKASLELQAAGAIADHAQGVLPSSSELHAIAEFQKTSAFFTSPALQRFANGGPAPDLPKGNSPSERRGRRFFEDVPPDPAQEFKPGLCAHCHSGPLLNKTNQFAQDFIGLPIPAGERFISVAVSEFNAAQNPVHEYVFNPGAGNELRVISPDPGRALISGLAGGFTNPADIAENLLNVNAFKISPLRGIRLTAPYFHDNSAKTLEDVAAHYALFFNVVTGGAITLTPQDQADIVAYLKLLD